ncbi:formin-like protein 20 [Lolium rigidum]|uniref:formin-like protein 20 n=1 Tax=Lolium rigidum TaxID=89674 RepID=UPI001F5CE7DC|nr:formin-like protein 20 [Lolium rigidum]
MSTHLPSHSATMALMRKLFARKAMDGLSPVSERVFVFNSCMSTEALDEDTHKDYLTSTIIQLKGSNPYASLMVINFAAAPTGTDAVHSLLRQGTTAVVTDYPSRYAGYGAAWPVLAFAMASLLVYIEEAAPEQRTLDAVYGRAPVEMLSAGSPLDPRPSHLRYLQYVARLRDKGSLIGIAKQERFVLDCLIFRAVPDFDGGGGCRPVVRVHGEPRLPHTDASPEVLFSTSRIKQQFKHYKQADCVVIKADIGCQIQGDVVIECIHVGDENHEDIMFRVMFNTCFLRSNMMVFTLDDIDLPWNGSKEKFQQDFKIEVFFSEVELSDIDESHDDCELSSLGNEDEFYDFDEILIDSDFDLKDHEWHGETSRQVYSQEADLHTEGSETGASDSASGSSEERGDDDDIGASDSASNSSEEKGGISTDDEAGLIHGGNVTRQSKDPRLGETSYLLEVGSSSSIPPIVPTRSMDQEMSTSCQNNKSAQEGAIPEGLIPMQDGPYGALNHQPMRKTRQKQAAIISPVPIIRKKIRKDTGSDDKNPTISNRVASQQGALVATSSSRGSTPQAKTTSSPPKEYDIANRLKQGAAQARRTSNLSKEHLKHSSQQQARGDPTAQKNFANGTATRSEVKQIVFTRHTTPSFAPSPLGRELNQQDNKGSHSPLDKNKKPVTRPSENPMTGKTQKQEATVSSVVDTPRRTAVMKKSLSLPVISEMATIASSGKIRTMTSLPGVNTSRPSSGFHIAASSLSPRANKHGISPPSSPGRSPLAGSKAHRAVPVARPDMQQGTSAPVRLPRRASLSELSKSLSTPRASDGHSLSPKTSRVIQNHPEPSRASARSLSPLSPKSTRTHPSTKSTVTHSSSKDNNRTGAAPARPTRLSS